MQSSCCRLCELNAIRQVFNVCSSPAVQGAWAEGRELSVHGLAYSVGDGLLKVNPRALGLSAHVMHLLYLLRSRC